MLNVCIPISHSDIDIFHFQVKALLRFGGLEGHKLTVFAAPSVHDRAADIASPLSSLVNEGNFAIVQLDSEPEQGWPIGPNQHYVAVVNKLREMGNTCPWVWLEPDAYPVTFGAWNALESERNMAKKPFCGHLRLTKEVMPGADGKHMVGVGVYPEDYATRFSWWNICAQRNDQPFDVLLRWEHIGPGTDSPRCHDTKLIQHCPRSKNYRVENGKTVGTADVVSPGNEILFNLTKDAVIVHGCKDGSLAELVCSQSGIIDKDGTPIPVPVETPDVPEWAINDYKWAPILKAINGWTINGKPSNEGHAFRILREIMDTEPQQPALKTPEEPPVRQRTEAPKEAESNPSPVVKKEVDPHDVFRALSSALASAPENESSLADISIATGYDIEVLKKVIDSKKALFRYSGLSDQNVRLSRKGAKVTSNIA